MNIQGWIFVGRKVHLRETVNPEEISFKYLTLPWEVAAAFSDRSESHGRFREANSVPSISRRRRPDRQRKLQGRRQRRWRRRPLRFLVFFSLSRLPILFHHLFHFMLVPCNASVRYFANYNLRSSYHFPLDNRYGNEALLWERKTATFWRIYRTSSAFLFFVFLFFAIHYVCFVRRRIKS